MNGYCTSLSDSSGFKLMFEEKNGFRRHTLVAFTQNANVRPIKYEYERTMMGQRQQDALNGHKSVPSAAAANKKMRQEKRTEAAAQVITKKKKLNTSQRLCPWLSSLHDLKEAAGAFGWTSGQMDKCSGFDWLLCWPGLLFSLCLCL